MIPNSLRSFGPRRKRLLPYFSLFTGTKMRLLLWLVFCALAAADESTDPGGNCADGEMYCDETAGTAGGKCIPLKWKCDGEFDCIDRTDEPPTCPPKDCKSTEFRCELTNLCLPASYRCDREFDCGRTLDGKFDFSDEINVKCKDPFDECPPGTHRCAFHPTCLPYERFCDSIVDCPDRSDEHFECHKNLFSDKQNNTCKYGAVSTVDKGTVCFCPQGQLHSGDDCVDEDECLRPLNGFAPVCGHHCKNLVVEKAGDRRFECSCADGFKLIDGTWCQGSNVPENEEATGIFVTATEILHRSFHNMSLDDTRVLDKTSAETGTLGTPIAIDHRRRRVCSLKSVFSPSTKEKNNDFECISIDKDGKFSQKTLLEPQYDLAGVNTISYDWVGNNWYFLDYIYRRIFVCDGDTMKRCITVAKRGLRSRNPCS